MVVVVPPWNFPYAIPSGGVLAALAAGNAVILKPAPETVATGWLIVQQLWAAGVPRDVLQFVPTRDDEVGQHLVTHVEGAVQALDPEKVLLLPDAVEDLWRADYLELVALA